MAVVIVTPPSNLRTLRLECGQRRFDLRGQGQALLRPGHGLIELTLPVENPLVWVYQDEINDINDTQEIA